MIPFYIKFDMQCIYLSYNPRFDEKSNYSVLVLDEADQCYYLSSDGGRQVLVNSVSEFVNQDIVGPEVGVILITQDVVL